jgi:adenylate kinase family enzyme
MRFNEFYQPLDEGVYDPNIFKAVFMAGSPGSGKTTIANKLFAGTGLKSLNVDDFYNYLRQTEKTTGDKEADYDAAWDKYRKREQNYLDGRLGLIIDGTGKNPIVMNDVKSKLEELGYETAMVFVNTTLETSLSRARQRASQVGKDYGREIDPKFIEDTWLRVQRGLGQLQNIFGKKFFIIDNNRGEPNIGYVENSLDKWLKAPPQSHIAKEWIKNELQSKQK